MQPTTVTNVSVMGDRFDWNVSGTLGSLPGSYGVDTHGTLNPQPALFVVHPPIHPASQSWNATLAFDNSNAGNPFQVSLALETTGLSNPAVNLPTVLNTTQFLTSHDIHFLMLSNSAAFFSTTLYYEVEFGFHVAYTNSEWQILQG